MAGTNEARIGNFSDDRGLCHGLVMDRSPGVMVYIMILDKRECDSSPLREESWRIKGRDGNGLLRMRLFFAKVNFIFPSSWCLHSRIVSLHQDT